MINRRTRELSPDDIKQIADTYHNWRNNAADTVDEGNPDSFGKGVAYEDIAGFCAAVSIDKVKELDYVLTPGRYVGLPDDEDDFDFNERFAALQTTLHAQLEEETLLNHLILANLAKIGVNTEGV